MSEPAASEPAYVPEPGSPGVSDVRSDLTIMEINGPDSGESVTTEVRAEPVLSCITNSAQSEQTGADNDWYSIVSSCGLAGISGNILWNCIIDSIEADCYRLILDETQSALFSPDHQQAIAGALSEYSGRALTVEIRVAPVAEETPAARRRREKSEAIAAVHQIFYDDAGVNALLQVFDASIEPDSLEIAQRS